MTTSHERGREDIGAVVQHLVVLIREVVHQDTDHVALLLPLRLQMRIDFAMPFDQLSTRQV